MAYFITLRKGFIENMVENIHRGLAIWNREEFIKKGKGKK